MYRLIIAVLLPVSVLAQKSYTLEEAITQGIENHPNVKIARFDIAQSKEQVKEIRGAGFPQVNFEGAFNHYPALPVNLIPAQFFNPMAGPDDFIAVKFGTDYNVNGTLSVGQLLFDGSYLTGLQAAKMYPVLSEKNVEKVQRDVRLNIERAYFMAAVAEENITILEATNLFNKKLLQQAESVLDVGMSDSTLFDQMRLSVMRIESQIKKAQGDRLRAIDALKFSMGIPLSEEISISEDIHAIVDKIGLDELRDSYDPKADIEHELLETRLELLNMNLKVKKSAYLPSLSAFFTQQYTAQRNEFNFFADEPWYPMTLWGLKLQIPIYSGGMKRAQQSQVEIDIEKAKTQQELLDQGLKLEYRDAKTEFITSYDQYQTSMEALEIAQLMRNRVKKKYNVKTINVMELTQAELQLLEATGNYVQAMYALLNAKVKLDKFTNSETNE